MDINKIKNDTVEEIRKWMNDKCLMPINESLINDLCKHINDTFLNLVKASFVDEIKQYALETRPKEWRYGQAVFNYIDKFYGVARDVQFVKGIDCFYDDNQVDKFIDECWNTLMSNEE